MGLAGRVWLAAVVAGALCGALPARAVQATLIADSHVNSALPSVNSGTISNLNVGAGYTALVQFGLGTLPAGTTSAQVVKATLRMYCNRVNTPGLVSFATVGGSWGEYSVTYATLPPLGAAMQVATVSQADAYVTVDVTSTVQGWIAAPATNNGLALTAGTASVQFDSKENDLTSHPAMLDITLASQGPAGPAGAQGFTGATGAVGPAGPVGPMGPAGPAGTGTGGTVTLGYQGAYASSMNYTLNDVVTFQGSSYVSLLQGNLGNTPGLSPVQWGLLAAGGTGPAGPIGPQGVPGPLGPVGGLGPAGPTGAQGVAGPVGPQGTAGMVYQGNYSSGVNYGLGDVVLWQGTSYTSLMAGNHGNTPSFSPVQWGVLSPQGPAGVPGVPGPQGTAGPQGLPGSVGPNGPPGPQGLQGIAGQAGAQGITGTTGAQGLQGPLGPQGVPGPVGMTFQGTYSSTVNYGLADGVLYGGAGYVSLLASNQGNTPGLSPAAWSMFATGTPGVTGPAGPTGLQGPSGPVGPQGVAGTPGATGATGPQGPAVANYTGNYASGTNYALHDAASYGGSTYVSLVAGNVGNTPGLTPADWALLAAQGPAGIAGAPGAAGPAGAAGVTGPQGLVGPQGPPVSFRGGWLTGQSYAVGDAVGYSGSSYVALVANSGRQPDVSPMYWALLAQAGGAGPTGATGPQGLQGPTGFPGPAGATGAAGPAGAMGPQGLTGPVGASGAAGPTGATGAAGPAGLVYRGGYSAGVNYGLNDAVTYLGSSYISLTASNQGNVPVSSPSFWSVLAAQGSVGAAGSIGATGLAGPQGNTGAAGAAGAAGPAGPSGVNFRGVWSGGASYAVSDAAQFAGTTYYATANSSGMEPDLYPAAWSVLAAQGTAGPSGPSGAAAAVTVGTVTTGLAGTQATVTNSGTSSAAVLNFTIPQGAAGANGTGGGAGGGGFASMYHAVSFNYSYYSLNNIDASSGETAAVLTWVPTACTATNLTVFSQQGNTITVKLRQGVAGTMADTVLVCVVGSGSTCNVTGSVPVAAGSFLDLSMSGASGTAAGVWTAVGCS